MSTEDGGYIVQLHATVTHSFENINIPLLRVHISDLVTRGLVLVEVKGHCDPRHLY